MKAKHAASFKEFDPATGFPASEIWSCWVARFNLGSSLLTPSETTVGQWLGIQQKALH